MPTHVAVQCQYAQDTALARDRIVMTPCFRWDNLTPQDASSLANNVLDAFLAAYPTHAATHSIAKVYDLEGTKPVLPMAEVERGPTLLTTSNIPREIALCLSFKGGPGAPRNRGRLYVPAWWAGSGSANRPADSDLNQVLQLGQHLFDVGGENVQWIVWSRVARLATGINQVWVDDEWDTQRRRGFRSTKRLVDDVS
jgi:hypothetical protein